ncbi:VOC family protein [Clostridium folliculivorans]|uniref:Glyoxalase n=1 Tax=Clostridium folliculivorans TaxID=2886038 RepID=A0A9W6DBY2_9CLOT|nr:VOC family protein [Clostridium folliculivorans]GKU26759.1 glyoxalase [Clostridium folliculivorans]GKU31353.1 glyoxalase [Clostridium folliculivorans]
MKIAHLALWTRDLERTKNFYSKYFNAVPNEKYHNEKTKFSSYFLSFDDGSKLEIMEKPTVLSINVSEDYECFGYAHVAFSVGSVEKVDELTKLLVDDGYTVVSGPRTTGDGYYESCILDHEGNRIEITV